MDIHPLPKLKKNKHSNSTFKFSGFYDENLNNEYRNAFSKINETTHLINNRLEKLKAEKKILRSNKSQFFYNPFIQYQESKPQIPYKSYNYSNEIQQNNQPIYVPLNLPIKGEPLKFPQLALGQPVFEDYNKGKQLKRNASTLNNRDLMILMIAAMSKNQNQSNPMLNYMFGPNPMQQQFNQQNINSQNIIPNSQENVNQLKIPTQTKLKKPTPLNQKNLSGRASLNEKKQTDKKQPTPIILKKKTPITENRKSELLRTVRKITNAIVFYFTVKKYSENKHQRNNKILQAENEAFEDFSLLKEFQEIIHKDLIAKFLSKSLLFEIDVEKDHNEIKIKESYKKIMEILNTILKNLYLFNDNNLHEEVKKILQKYSYNGSYFPKKYLTTFEVNRCQFDFYGALKDVNSLIGGLLLSYLIINRSLIQSILIRIKESNEEADIDEEHYSNLVYICKIINELVKGIYLKNLPKTNDNLSSLMNYYRNYHIENKTLEETKDVNKGKHGYEEDHDELLDSFPDFPDKTDFIQENKVYCEKFQDFLLQWGKSCWEYVNYESINKNKRRKTLNISKGDSLK